MPNRFTRVIEASYSTLRQAWRGALRDVDARYPGLTARAGLGDASLDSLVALGSADPLPDPETVRTRSESPGHVFTTACLRLLGDGVGVAGAVEVVRMLFGCLEGSLAELGGSAEEHLDAWRRLMELRDVVESALLVEAEAPAGVVAFGPGTGGTGSEIDDVGRRQFEDLYLTTTELILFTDGEGRVEDANPVALDQLGREALLGRDVCAALGIAGQGNAALRGGMAPGQQRELALSLGGHQRHFVVRTVPRADCVEGGRGGACCGLMVVMHDITCLVDHREALAHEVESRTQALERSEAMLGAVFESVGDGILVADAVGEILQVNDRACELFGLAHENLVGTPVQTLFDAAGAETLDEVISALPRGELRTVEVPAVYIDGRTFPAALTVTRFDLDQRRFIALLVRDVTEERQLQRQMLDERNRLEEMNVTLRNVLTSIERDRRETQHQLAVRIRDTILPALGKVRRSASGDVRGSFLDLVEAQLVGLTEGTSEPLDAGLLRLSRTELKVCRLIQGGASSKAIGEAMNLSLETVQTHRKNIRRKLGLQGKRVNLYNYLSARRPGGDGGEHDVER